MRETTPEEYREELLKYLQIKKEGSEQYPDCPRCHGSRYVYAVTDPDAYRYVWEEFPCPLCHEVGSIDVDDCIKWLMEKAEVDDLAELEEQVDGA